MLKHVRLMTRPDCSLCEEPKRFIQEAAEAGLCTWESVNIDQDRDLKRLYGWDIPVVLINDAVCFKHRMDKGAFMQSLKGQQ
ncbi:MAG: glutaredoxin family protein [Mariprofundaceae bacterium]|nr:glutaredoxin family protein [Mariprofundaceae bacterium]